MRLAKRCLSCGLLLAFAARAIEPAPPPPPPDESPAPAPAPVPVPVPALRSASGEPSWSLRVHLLTEDDRVELRRLSDNSLVCRTPCGIDVRFDEADAFALDGKWLMRSKPFQFRPRDGEVKLRVSSGSAVPIIIGGGLLGIGGTIAVVGGLVFLGANWDNSLCYPSTCHAENDAKAATAATVALIGLGVVLVGGIVMAFGVASRTSYTVEP
jgi:hypothetical protein